MVNFSAAWLSTVEYFTVVDQMAIDFHLSIFIIRFYLFFIERNNMITYIFN